MRILKKKREKDEYKGFKKSMETSTARGVSVR